MKIAVLGGSFDPPHLGHYLIARQVIEQTDVDRVWLLPNYSTALFHKIFKKQLSPAEDRLAMAGLLENEFINSSNFEINFNKDSITIITLEMLIKQFPEHTFYWITGSDKLETFHMYDRWKDLVSKHNLIIFPREHMLWHLEARVKEAFALQKIPKNILVLQNKSLILTNISSSLIRERVGKGLSIRYLVPKGVEEYIKEHKLYAE